METTQQTGSKTDKWLKGLLKLLISATCLWYVSGKIDLAAARQALQAADWSWSGLALLLFIASKIVSAFRLNFYFRNIGIRLSETANLRLYWLGMLYNLALPGSVSGDAYKVILLTKRFDVRYRKTTAAVLLDRFSGLLGLGILLAVYGFISLPAGKYPAGIAVAVLCAVSAYWFVLHRWLRDFLPSFFPTLLLGSLVQLLQVLCAYAIMAALHVSWNEPAYIFLFLLSSAVAVLPLTIGGLGLREIVFLKGAGYFGLAAAHSVLISLLFYLITLATSAAGFWYVFHDPLPKRKDP